MQGGGCGRIGADRRRGAAEGITVAAAAGGRLGGTGAVEAGLVLGGGTGVAC